MKLVQTAIPEVVIVEPRVFEDERGWFFESFNEERFVHELMQLGLPAPSRFVQDNHSLSKKNVLRGLHYQLHPSMQGKLVRVTQGAAYDVAVDIREDSPTFGQSVGVELSAKNRKMLWIPEGFAHGFVALEEDTHFLYKTTDFYNKDREACIRWDDPTLNVQWPKGGEFLINEKDRTAPSIDKAPKLPFIKHTQPPEGMIDLSILGDSRGSLIVIEEGVNIHFNLKRSYYIFATKDGVSRGFHAHKCLQQLAVCVAGKCRIVLDNGKERKDYWLDSPTQGLFINNMTWREMHDFSEDCVLVVFASQNYNENDYIRDYQQFLASCQNA